MTSEVDRVAISGCQFHPGLSQMCLLVEKTFLFRARPTACLSLTNEEPQVPELREAVHVRGEIRLALPDRVSRK
jgi:hypothetical protein